MRRVAAILVSILVVIVAAACTESSSGQAQAADPKRLHSVPDGCRPAVDLAALDSAAGESSTDIDPLATGQPLAGLIALGMEGTEVQAELQRLGLCYTFRLEYRYLNEPTKGYSEIWCDAPPGEVYDVLYSRQSVVAFVESPELRTPRPQPELGWGC